MNQLISQYALILTLLATIFPANSFFGSLHAHLAEHAMIVLQPAGTQLTRYSIPAYRPFPYKNQAAAEYKAAATAAVVYDLDAAQYLYQKNSDQKLPIASITKIATALVILKDHRLDEIMTVPEGINLPADSERVGIKPQEKFTLHEALRIMLIPSANDMAEALAVWDAGSRDKFVNKMNQQANLWGLKNTHFANPTGLDEANHFSSPADLVILTTILLQNNEFKEIIDTAQYTAKNQADQTYNLTSTNKLLAYDYIHGVKTGLTVEAGQTLITLAERNAHKVVGVVLNSPNRFQESKNMLDWAFANHTWK